MNFKERIIIVLIIIGLGFAAFYFFSPRPKIVIIDNQPADKNLDNGVENPGNNSVIPVQNKPVTKPVTVPSKTESVVAGCQVFPADNPWNQDVLSLPVRADSDFFISHMRPERSLHADFGENQTYGIPFNVVSQNQQTVPTIFTAYAKESDPGPYPVPENALVEGGSQNAITGDRHLIVLQTGTCMLYEMVGAHKNTIGQGWLADGGAIFNLNSNKLRQDFWTSADGAGLPIFPGIVKYSEVASGEIKHAIRFTMQQTQNGFIHPATHFAGYNDPKLAPMGLRVRLKESYDISKLTGQALVIAKAMKKYGMILADNGGAWYFSGETNPGWKDEELNELKTVPGSAFEVVDTGPIIREKNF